MTLHVSASAHPAHVAAMRSPGAAVRAPTQQLCQGMGCKHASRALTNSYLPELALACPPDVVDCDRSPPTRPSPSQLDTVRTWDFCSYFTSGSFKDRSQVALSFARDGTVQGDGTDNMGRFFLTGHLEPQGSSQALYVSKTYAQHRPRQNQPHVNGHIDHVLWSGPTANDGFWGVWEITSNDSPPQTQSQVPRFNLTLFLSFFLPFKIAQKDATFPHDVKARLNSRLKKRRPLRAPQGRLLPMRPVRCQRVIQERPPTPHPTLAASRCQDVAARNAWTTGRTTGRLLVYHGRNQRSRAIGRRLL